MNPRTSRHSPLNLFRGGAIPRILNLVLILAVSTLSVAGCGQDRVTGVRTPVTGDNASNKAVNEANATAARYEQWITAMEPFVHHDSGTDTYTLDRDAFVASLRQDHPLLAAEISGTTPQSEDAVAIDMLAGSVQKGNEIRAQMGSGSGTWRSGGLAASVAWCSYHWWGVTCCYTGSDADRMIALLTGSAFVSSFWWVSGAILGAIAWWANYMNDHCPGGGFCLSVSWAGVPWVTCRS